MPQTWGIVIGKALTDPVWFFLTDWFAIYLVSRGFRLEDSLLAFWVPFLAADCGNFFGGGCSSALIARGWSVGAARKIVIVFSAVAMMFLIPAAYATSLAGLTICVAIATFAYAALSTMILNLPADLYPSGSVASVSGLSGTGAGVGTVLATYLTGIVADRYSFQPVLMVAARFPLSRPSYSPPRVRPGGRTQRQTGKRTLIVPTWPKTRSPWRSVCWLAAVCATVRVRRRRLPRSVRAAASVDRGGQWHPHA